MVTEHFAHFTPFKIKLFQTWYLICASETNGHYSDGRTFFVHIFIVVISSIIPFISLYFHHFSYACIPIHISTSLSWELFTWRSSVDSWSTFTPNLIYLQLLFFIHGYLCFSWSNRHPVVLLCRFAVLLLGVILTEIFLSVSSLLSLITTTRYLIWQLVT